MVQKNSSAHIVAAGQAAAAAALSQIAGITFSWERLRRIVILAALIGGLSLGHYSTGPERFLLHDFYRRAMYLPIILAGFWYGIKGGLLTAVVISTLYAPHLLFQLGLPPAAEMDRVMEMVLYVVVGGVTGVLAEREKAERLKYVEAAAERERAYRELRSHSERLAEIEAELRLADRLATLGELSASLAHEVGHPLASVKGAVQILLDEFPPEHPKREFADILLKEVDRLHRVVEDYKKLGRVGGQKEGPTDINAVLTSVLSLMEREAHKRGIQATARLASDLPQVRGEEGRLRQVFVNLILNAVQAMEGGGRLTVESRQGNSVPDGTPEAEGDVEVIVSDSGPGVAAEDLPLLFEPFFTTKPGGTGLGLSIARRIVEEYGGKIRVNSAPGEGTTFTVRLPVYTPFRSSPQE